MAKRKAARDRAAARITVRGRVQGVFFRETTRERAGELGVMGWVRNQGDGTVLLHAEASSPTLDELLAFLHHGPEQARVDEVEVRTVKPEGHEQFAVRGVSAGGFIVLERQGEGDMVTGYELRLEVDGALRAWSVPKAPSMDPAVKRLAIPVQDGAEPSEGAAAGEATVWDSGSYEQGGRVAWPEALERGHAVFVLHGDRLRGGFALQRTGRGAGPRWLLIKRRDEFAEPNAG